MADRPIIFSAPMVRALLAGRKTMTRRLRMQKRKPERVTAPYDHYVIDSPWVKARPGDRLWVREAWMDMLCDPPEACYRADGERPHSVLRWRPSIHMPRWASRLTLTVTAMRIERLQDITDDDAMAEGCRGSYPFTEDDTARKDFRSLWRELHGTDAWEQNPEVVVISFTVAKRNIDANIRASDALFGE